MYYLTAVGIRCADHVTPLYPQKLALTSPAGGGRSVGIVRSRTKATEFMYYFVTSFMLYSLYVLLCNVSSKTTAVVAPGSILSLASLCRGGGGSQAQSTFTS
jgi:hypothetical protein